jgi:transcription initiation factor TFIIF subunit beta
MLYRLFKEYKYWRLGDLKAKTNQPETYLKETLAKIAYLVKSGPNANTWTLTQEAQATTYVDVVPKEEVAPDEGQDDLDEDDNLEMEDAM